MIIVIYKEENMGIIICIIIVVLLLVLWIISVYNGLVKSRMKTTNAWSQIDVQLQRRFDLIPNLVETVKGYMKHEEETFTKIAELRTAWANTTTVYRSFAIHFVFVHFFEHKQ